MRQVNIYQEDQIASPMLRMWLNFSANPFALAGLWTIGFLLLLTVFGPMIAPFPPEAQDPKALLLPPSWDPSGTVAHFLGTDDLGRDI
ncbi:MAG: peptide ABC transporter permease, partial [Shewanella sp.]